MSLDAANDVKSRPPGLLFRLVTQIQDFRVRGRRHHGHGPRLDAKHMDLEQAHHLHQEQSPERCITDDEGRGR